MGIHNRDYARVSPGAGGMLGGSSGGGEIVRKIVMVTAGVFLLQLLSASGRGPDAVTSWLVMKPGDVLLKGQVWRLLSYALLHDRLQLFHILANMWMLWMFGREVAGRLGDKEFLLFYCAAAVFAAIAYTVVGLITGMSNPMLGASGAVMAVAMLYAIYWPTRRVLLFGVIPMEMRWLVTLFIAQDVLFGIKGGDNIAHSAHLGGVAFGALYHFRQMRLEALFTRTQSLRRARQPKVKLFEPEVRRERNRDSNLEAQVDQILDKINRHGEASLTDRERSTLQRASEKFKNRP